MFNIILCIEISQGSSKYSHILSITCQQEASDKFNVFGYQVKWLWYEAGCQQWSAFGFPLWKDVSVQ